MYIIPLCKSNYVLFEVQCVIINKSKDKKAISKYIGFRDVTTGATGATSVAPKFSDTLTLS